MFLYDLQEKKEKILSENIVSVLAAQKNENAVREAVAKLMRGEGVRFTPPVMSFHMNYVTVSKDYRGTSIKPGNIFLNARRFFYELPSLVVLSSDFKEQGWLLKAMAFIVLWQQLLNLSKLHIDKDETLLLSALWHIGGREHLVGTDEGFSEVNVWRHRLDWQEADWDTYLNWLADLEKGRHVKVPDDSRIFLCEEVNVKYT